MGKEQKERKEQREPKELKHLPGFVKSRLERVGEHLFGDIKVHERVTQQLERDIAHLHNPTIYIHVPFCRTQCDFCDFPTALFNHALGAGYIRALDAQITHLKSKFPNLDMAKLYIGGGTPATLLNELLDLLEKHGIGADQLSMEAHPQDFAHISDQDLARMSTKITRVSIGVQTFNPKLLEAMNRSNGRDPEANIQKALHAGMLVNVDLIYGLEHQSIESFVEDLQRLIGMGVPQITCYPLMGKHTDRGITQPEQDFYQGMLTTFAAHGYTAITPWCFTNSPEALSQGEYISQTDADSREQILALGVGGISKIGNTFAINHFSIGDYFSAVSKDKLPVMRTKKLSALQEAQYFLLTGLFGMSIDTNSLTPNSIANGIILAELIALRKLGIVEKDESNPSMYKLTEQGMFYMSNAMASFYAGLGKFRRPHNEQILEGIHEGGEPFGHFG